MQKSYEEDKTRLEEKELMAVRIEEEKEILKDQINEEDFLQPLDLTKVDKVDSK